MTWALYTRLTARNRAIEALVAGFVFFWSIIVLQYWASGTNPLGWAGLPEARQWQHPAALLAACVLHMAGTALDRPWPLPALMRAAAMASMASVMAHLSWLGGGQSAMPTYLALSAACLGGLMVALRDARFAREVNRAA